MKSLSRGRASLNFALTILLSGVYLGGSSCAPLLGRPAPSEKVPAEELVESLSERAGRLRTLRALATVYYRGAEGRGGVQEAILVDRPDRVRLETLSPLGATLIVTVNPDEVAALYSREGRFYRGRASRENLLRTTRIPLEVGELTALLMGLPPVEIGGKWRAEEDSVVWEQGGGRSERVTFDHALRVPVRWERGSGGAVELSATFSDFISTPLGSFPGKISFQDHIHQRRLEVRYQEPELNVALPSSLFAQTRPNGASEVPLESLGS